jgi:hypothetical protein
VIKRPKLLLLFVGIGIVCLIPKEEYTFEFDGVNLQLRDCSRYRSWLWGFVIWERCSAPQEHPTAVRLRQLGALGPNRSEDERWLLMSGFKPGVRGWRGPGRDYVRALGATTFGTAVTLPAQEELAENLWIKWALADPPAVKHFWQELQSVELQRECGAYFLEAAKEYLENHGVNVGGANVEAHAHRAIEN